MKQDEPAGASAEADRGGVTDRRPQKALVQCEGYRCLAFRDASGRWKDTRGKAIQVLEVLREF